MEWVDKEKLLKYRRNMKSKLEEMLEKHNRVAMQEPTGIGKSYMMIEMCREKEGNKIIFEPTRVLADKFEDEIKGTNTKTMIYQNLLHLSNIDLENMFKNVDYLFLDEVHRIGAEQWGAQIKKIFKMFPEMKIIGLTATPVRTDKINVFTKFFDDIQTEPMDLLTAIEERLLPQITYVTAYASISKEVNSRREAIQQSKKLFSETKQEYLRILETYRHKLESIMNIPNILKKYIKLEKIDNKNFKVLLFVSRLNQIDEAEKESLKWFSEAFPEKKINIYKLKNVGREKNGKEVKNFENNTNINDIDIMISVNKLIEGFHIKRVSSAIFLRRTCSNIVFLQQIGRTLSESKPIIFDFVENHKSVGNGLEWDFEKFRKNIKKYSATRKDDKINKPIIWLNDELLETEKIFKKFPINNLISEEKIKQINNFLIKNKENLQDLKIKEIADKFSVHSATIVNIMKTLGLYTKRKRNQALTDDQNKILLNFAKENEGKLTLSEITEYVNKNILKIENNKNNIRATKDIIQKRLSRNNIKYITSTGKYSNVDKIKEKEILKLIKDNPELNKTSIAILAGYKYPSESKFRNKANLDPITYVCKKNNIIITGKCSLDNEFYKNYKEIIKYVNENNDGKLTIRSIAHRFNCSEGKVSKLLKKNKITINYSKRTYEKGPAKETIEIKDFIIKNGEEMTRKEIAQHFNCNPDKIHRICIDYNLKTKMEILQYFKNSDSEKFILENWKIMTRKELSLKTSEPVNKITNFLHYNNLKLSKEESAKLKGRKDRKRYPSDEELKYINENKDKETEYQISKKLNVSEKILRRWCNEYNIIIKKLSAKQLVEKHKKFILDNWKKGMEFLMSGTNLNYNTINSVLHRNNIFISSMNKKNTKNTEETKLFIQENFQNLTKEEIVNKTGCTYRFYYDVIREYYGGKNPKSKREFTKEEKEFIKNNAGVLSREAIAKELNCSVTPLKRLYKELNIQNKYCKGYGGNKNHKI